MNKKLVSLLLAATVVIGGLAGCGNEEKVPESKSEEKVSESASESTQDAEVEQPDEQPKEIVEIDFLQDVSQIEGLADGYLGRMLEREGIHLNLIKANSDVINARLVSGDLGDLVSFHNSAEAKLATDADMLINLDDYKDQLPHLYENEVLQGAIKYARDTYTDDGGLYIVQAYVGPCTYAYGPQTMGLYLDWDLYMTLKDDYPLNSFDDLVDFFVAMKELKPQTESGLETYALPVFSEWDGAARFTMANIWTSMGYSNNSMNHFIEIDMFNDEKASSIFEDDSAFKECLQFYNKLYQNGLMDPDGMTQTYENACARVGEGVYLGHMYGPGVDPYYNTKERLAEGDGYGFVYFDGLKVTAVHSSYTGLDRTMFGISKDTENLDACLKMVDLLCDFDFVWELNNGPEGLLWEMGEDGVAHLTEEGWKQKELGTSNITIDGEEIGLGDSGTPAVIAGDVYVEKYGQRISRNRWLEWIVDSNDNEFARQWTEETGYATPMELLYDKDAYSDRSAAYFSIPAMPDDMNFIHGAVGQVLLPACWKAIYAEDDATFEKIWTEMVDDCMEVGAQDLVDWALDEFAKAKANIDKYKVDFE